MSTLEVEDDDEVILVEFAPAPGVRTVARSPQEILEQSIEDSKKAIDRAMRSIRGMAKKTMKTIKEIPVSERPSTISVSFGLKLDAEAGAVVAKAGAEASMNVTMSWTHTAKAK
ncbi:MAG TPA: CU044_2847 family protein [Anaerolineales bacterium]|nr:CU044_2847 family protein [Anaerolineales bacterium]